MAEVNSPDPSTLISAFLLEDETQLLVVVETDFLRPSLGNAVKVHDGVFGAEDVSEAALGQTAVQRHLAAFKAAHQAEAGTRTLALVAAG